MFNFIEGRITKYLLDHWWEPYKKNHPNFKHWFDNTRQNATNVCPDDLLEINTATSVFGAMKKQKGLGKSISMRTGVYDAYKGASFKQAGQLTARFSYAFCGAAYIGGALDAAYQQNHGDVHLGMAVTDWFLDTGESIHHWYNNAKGSMHNLWEHVDDWWHHDESTVI